MLVTRLADLKPALAAGGEITLAQPWDINVSDVAPAVPASVTGPVGRLLLTRCRNMVFDGLTFRRSATRADGPDVYLGACSDITLSRFDMLGPATAFNDGTVPVAQGAMEISASQRVRVEAARINGYGFGIRGGDSDGLAIRGCELTRLQVGNRFSDLLIEGNYLHDFLGSLQALNHDDMIQLFTAGATVASHGIAIRRNRLVGGAGASTQMLFMGNEAKLPYRDVAVEGNYISGDDWHGITVYCADKPVIRNNFVLRKKGLAHNESGNDGIYIQNPDCTGSVVDGNVADRLKLTGFTGSNLLAANCNADQFRTGLDRLMAA